MIKQILNNKLYLILNFIFFSYILYRILLIFSYTPDLAGVEQNIVYSISNYMQGGELYSNPETGNYSISQYAPLMYGMNILFVKIFNLDSFGDIHSIYVIGRALSLVLNIMSFLLFYKLLVKRFYLNKKIVYLLSMIMFFSLWRVYYGFRPDAYYNFIFIAIIYYFLNYKNNKKAFYYSAILVGSLFLAKQSAIQVIPIIPLYFFTKKEIKNGFLFGFVSVVSTMFFQLIAYFIYGDFYFKNIILGVDNGVSFINSIELFFNYFSKNTLLFITGGVGIIFIYNNYSNSRRYFLSIALLLSLLFAIVLCTKLGAGLNYFNEFGLLAILYIADLISTINDEKIINEFKIYLTTICVLLFPVYFLRSYFHEESVHFEQIFNRTEYLNKVSFSKMIKGNILKYGDKILTFDVTLNSLLAKDVVIPNKDIVPNCSSFNYDYFNNDFKNKKIKYIIQNKHNFEKTFMGFDLTKMNEKYSNKDFIIFENE